MSNYHTVHYPVILNLTKVLDYTGVYGEDESFFIFSFFCSFQPPQENLRRS